METKIDVLNEGFVRLVSYTQPIPRDLGITDFDGEVLRSIPKNWSGDLEIVRNARVSFDADWRTGDNEGADEKLIHYMYSNNHTSPFEAMSFTFEVMVPIFITRQWHRHRTWSYNEVSARYAELPDVFYVPEPETMGVQSKDNKQARDQVEMSQEDIDTRSLELRILEKNYEKAYELYKSRIAWGWSRELARVNLPVGIYTRFFASVDLHNLFHFLKLRLHEHAQYEIRVYAEAMLELITPIVPISVDAFNIKREEDEAIDRIRKIIKENKWKGVEVFNQLADHAQDWANNKII